MDVHMGILLKFVDTSIFLHDLGLELQENKS